MFNVQRSMCSTLLQVNLHASDYAAALWQLSEVYALSEDAVGHGELGVATQVLGEGEQVVASYPELHTLYVLGLHGEVVAQRDRLQPEVRAVFYPAVAEACIAHGVLEGDAWNVGLHAL